MKIILTKAVKKWFDKQQDISEEKLIQVANEIMGGRVEASLGSHLYKKRIASQKGKSSGARSIVAYCDGSHMFFLYAFKKNEKENISQNDLHYFKVEGRAFLSLSHEALEELAKREKLFVIGEKYE